MTDVINLTKKAFTWSVVVMTIAWSIGLSALAAPLAANGAECPTLEAGDLFKVKGNTAVYLLNSDMKRLYFPTSEVFHTWFSDFSGVVEIDSTCVSAYPNAVNPSGVDYRPGSRLVKVTISPEVYAVGTGNVRHLLGSEEEAKALYGDNWASLVRDVHDFHWPNYTTGAEVNGLHNGMLVKRADSSMIYAVVDGKLTAVDGTLSSFVAGDVHTVASSLVDALELNVNSVTAASLTADPSQGSGSGTPGTPVPAGNLSVSLSANTPVSTTVARGSINVDFLKFNVKAGDTAVTLDEMTVKRSGVGAVTGLKVYVYDGNTRVGSGKTFSSDTNEADFSVLGVKIPANSSKELTLRMESSSGSSGEHALSVKTLTATNTTVTGLPVTGSKMSITDPTAGTIAADGTGTLSSPTIGDKNVQLAQFSLVTATEDAMLESFTLKQDGTISTSLLSNFALKDGSTDVPVTVNVSDRLVTFTLSTPLKLVDGSTKTFKVYGDVSADTDVGKTIVFYMQYNTDIKAVGNSYGFGVLPNIGAFDEAGDSSTLTVAGGGLTISNLSASAHDVKTDTTSVVLGKVSLKAVSDSMEIQKMTATLDTTSSTSGANDYGTYKDVNATHGYVSGTDTLLIRNIKLRDAVTGQTLGSAKAITDAVAVTNGNGTAYSAWAISADPNTGLAFQWTDYFTVKKGETRNIEIVADINSAQVSGVVYLTSFDFSSSNFTAKDSSDNTVTDIVPATVIASHNVTTRTSGLTVTRASSPESRTVVKGSTVDALGMIWAAGSGTGNDVKVTSLVVDTYVNASSTEAFFTINSETEVVAVTASSLVTSASLYVGDTLIAGPVSPDTNGRLQFTSSKFVGGYYTVPAGTSKTVVIKATVSGNAPYGSVNDAFAFTLDSADVSAEDESGSPATVTLSGDLNGTSAPTVAVTVTAQGTILTAADSGKPDASIVLAGLSTEQEVHRIRLTATKEAWVVDEMTLNASPSAAYDNVEYVQLYSSTGTQLGPNGGMGLDSSGNANFTGLSINVPSTGNTVVIVKAKLKAVGERSTATNGTAGVGADSGDDLEFRLDTTSGNFNAISASGATDIVADEAVGNIMVVRNTRPTVAISALPSATLANGERTLMKFTVTAGATGDVVLASVKPYLTFNDASGAAAWLSMTSGTLAIYDVTGSEVDLNAVNRAAYGYALTSTSQQYELMFDDTKVVTIAAGTVRTFEIRANISGVESSDSIEAKFVRDSAALSAITETFANAIADSNDDFIWSDNSADTNAITSVEYINSFLLNLPTTVSTITKST